MHRRLLLTGGEVKIDRYEVLPGNYYKHFGTKLDSDLLPVKDGRTVRKGLLTDGKIRYATWNRSLLRFLALKTGR